MKEYRVSLRVPNKRFCLAFDERKIRILDYLENVMRARHYFLSKYGIDPPIFNGDQMPLHRYVKLLVKNSTTRWQSPKSELKLCFSSPIKGKIRVENSKKKQF